MAAIEIELPVVATKIEELIGLSIRVDGASGYSGKEALGQCLIEYYGEEGFNLMLGLHPFLVIDFKECGGSATYDTWEDVPEVDVPCPCGNPNHWLIKYEMS